MNRKHIAIIATVMGVAAVTMTFLFPISGLIAGFVTSLLDATFNTSWAPVPILLVVIPFSITYLLYCIGTGILLLCLSWTDDETYPPTDSQGRPMLLSFSSRGGPARWCPTHKDKETT